MMNEEEYEEFWRFDYWDMGSFVLVVVYEFL